MTRHVFEIDADQLLLAAYDAQLDCRRQSRVAVQVRIDRGFSDEARNSVSRLVGLSSGIRKEE